jgi:hypothetical protein
MLRSMEYIVAISKVIIVPTSAFITRVVVTIVMPQCVGILVSIVKYRHLHHLPTMSYSTM